MTAPSTYPPIVPLPPNRRIRKKTRAVLEAPNEQVGIDPSANGSEVPPPDEGGVPSRNGRLGEALRLGAGVAMTVLSALLCVWGLLKYTHTSPRFAVRTIDVHGATRRTPEDIARLAGIAMGQNVFAIDLEAARTAVLADPWVEQASLRRKLPQTITIDVVEREAAALLAIGQDLYLATRAGEPFKKPEPGDPYDLPVVTGIGEDDVVKDRAAVVSSVKRALDLAFDYERIGPAKSLPVQEVHVEDDGGLVLSVGKEVIQLHMGKGPYRQGLEQAARVLSELGSRHAQASVVFLDNEAHPERVVVRMR